jgi:hypothetical protein
LFAVVVFCLTAGVITLTTQARLNPLHSTNSAERSLSKGAKMEKGSDHRDTVGAACELIRLPERGPVSEMLPGQPQRVAPKPPLVHPLATAQN